MRSKLFHVWQNVTRLRLSSSINWISRKLATRRWRSLIEIREMSEAEMTGSEIGRK